MLAVSAAEAKRNIERRVALTNALYDIRKAVGEVNHTAGVDAKLTELARIENDDETLKVVLEESTLLEKNVEAMEFRRMFSHPMDANNCFINQSFIRF